MQLVLQGIEPEDIKKIECEPLDDAALVRVLAGYQSKIPLGMLEEYDDFRISVAGAQEKPPC